MSMVEIGPRFVLNVMKIFQGSFSGSLIYENPDFVAPAEIRRQQNAESSMAYKKRVEKMPGLEKKKRESELPIDSAELVFENDNDNDDDEDESD